MDVLSQQSAAAGPARTIRPGQILVIVCAGVVMASLDLFIVNVALPQISVDLHETSLGTLSWILNGYAIIYAALLVLAGRLADQRNRKTGFLLGITIFTVGSAACGAAGSVPMLIAFRLVQAAGAALLTPTSLGLVLASYPAERRGGAVRAWTAAGAMAAALGPVIGGLLVAACWSRRAGAGSSWSTYPSAWLRSSSDGASCRTCQGTQDLGPTSCPRC